MPDPPSPKARRRSPLEWARAQGRSAASFHALDRGVHHWYHRDGCVGYVDTGGAWVAAGNPLAARADERQVMTAFVQAARQDGKRAHFFAIEDLGELPRDFVTVCIGEQPIWNPQRWPQNLSKRLKGQIRRAKSNHIARVRQLSAHDLADPEQPYAQELEQLVEQWLQTRRAAPMDFLVGVDPHHLRAERRFFIAETDCGLLAALIAVPIYARNGWFLDTVLRSPKAPNGTIELLFDRAMVDFAAEGSEYVTFGLCPLSGVDSAILRMLKRLTHRLYNYRGLRRFKSKLGPERWQPVYIASPAQHHRAFAIWDCLGAFLPDGYVRFAGRTLLRQQDAVGKVAGLWLLVFGAASASFAAQTAGVFSIAVGCVLAYSLIPAARAFFTSGPVLSAVAARRLALLFAPLLVANLGLGALTNALLLQALFAVGSTVACLCMLFFYLASRQGRPGTPRMRAGRRLAQAESRAMVPPPPQPITPPCSPQAGPRLRDYG